MIWVDIIIILLLASSAYWGYRRGLILIGIDLVGFIIATLTAALTYLPVGNWLAGRFHVIPSFAAVLGYGLVFAVIQLLFTLVVHQFAVLIPKPLMQSQFNKSAGTAANVVKMFVMIGLFLIIFAGLPLSASQKGGITEARIPKLLLANSGRLQQTFNDRFGGELSKTLNFLTVKKGSSENISLGFTTTKYRINLDAENAMLKLVNNERISMGLKPLTANQTARQVARLHSKDMFERGYFSHINPDGQDPFDRMQGGGVNFGAAGENLALAPTLLQAHDGLMNSPEHRDNILSPDFNTVGIGVIDGGPYGLMVTQNFTD